MKWQEFYFEWLEKIGYYDWFNATLVGYKTPYPVGGRTNIGTVGFGGTGNPPIQDVPYVPTYTHPAQSLIESQLADTGVLTDLDAAARGYSRSFSGMFTTNINQILSAPSFGEAQKNTLRYWGYQPSGHTFSAPSNFYRGYAYHSNAMKQKKELRGRRGDVLIRDSKKSWFTDKKNRTYPSLRKNQSVPMVGIRHTDYSHYGDVGNLMEIAWGSMNGLSYSYNDADAATEEANLEDLEEAIASLNESDYNPEASTLSQTLGRGVGINAQLNGVPIEEYISQQASIRMPTEEDMRKINEINGFMEQKYLDNKGVIVRNKKFREIDYVRDKIRYDARQQINNLLLGVDSQMSVTTAEVILQILANPMLGINRQGEIEGGPIQAEIDTFMDGFIPRDTQIKIQELLLMHGPQNLPTKYVAKGQPTYIGSFYLGIPMNKLQFTIPTQITGSNDTFTWSWNETNVQQKFQTTRQAQITRGCTGYEELFSNQNTVGVAREVMGLWQDLEIVDDSIMPLIDTIVDYLPTIESSNYGLEKYANLNWLYSLPTWVNPNYALAIANSEIQNASSVDWQPKDIGFMINGQEQYLYEVKLSNWVQDFMNHEPDVSNQKYWAISMLFNQPITKKSRGSTSREILGLHQIVLDLSPTEGPNNEPKNKMVSNNLGMVNCNASEQQWIGQLNSNEDLISITYDFFSDVVEWPYHLELPGWRQQNSPNEVGLGEMQSYLTPMDNDTDWWNLFLDNDTGILSMDTTSNTDNYPGQVPRYDGWFIGWDFGYMDSIIQKAKAQGKPWAENLTLESFCKKVYHSETLKVHFYPKQDYADLLAGQVANASVVNYGARVAEAVGNGRGLFNNKNPANNFFSFTPFETRYASQNRNAPQQDKSRVRFNRPNELGGAAHIRSEATRNWLAILSNPQLGFKSIEDWTNFIDNDEGYWPTLQPAHLRRHSGQQAQFNSSSFRNGRLNGVTEAGGLEPLPKIVNDKVERAFTIMFQENGGIAVIPQYDPVVKSWTDEEWESLNAATGYSSVNVALTGNIISKSQEARGESYNPTFRSVAKCIINEEIPSDILEVEEMPESFVGRNIDYTMPSGTPWRRGKIFMINWVSILTPSILRMLNPEE